MLGFGFGFVEVGTLTPRAAGGQSEAAPVPARRGPGGDQPAWGSTIGARRRRWRGSRSATGGAGIVGVNIGANKDSADRIADYAAGVRAMAGVADYLTVNISSPNTPGLRALQDKGALDELLAAVDRGARRGAAGVPQGRARPRARRRSTTSPERRSTTGSTR